MQQDKGARGAQNVQEIESIFPKRPVKPVNSSLKNIVIHLAEAKLAGKNSVELPLEDKAIVNMNKKVD